MELLYIIHLHKGSTEFTVIIQVYIWLLGIYNNYIMVGIDDLEGLIQPKRSYDSV